MGSHSSVQRTPTIAAVTLSAFKGVGVMIISTRVAHISGFFVDGGSSALAVEVVKPNANIFAHPLHLRCETAWDILELIRLQTHLNLFMRALQHTAK